MESERFEHVQRVIAAQTSRRGLAGLFAGLALGGAVGLTSQGDAEVKPRRRRRKKKQAKKNSSAPFTPSPFAPKCIVLGNGCSTPSTCCDYEDEGTSGCGFQVCAFRTNCAAVAALKGGKSCPADAQCCRVNGATCTDACHCCGSLTCVSGECTACKNVGGTCTSRSDCCGSLLCIDGACGLCRNIEGACANHSDCCGDLLCHPEGYCANCFGMDTTCTASSECCGDSFCGGDGYCTTT